MDHARLVNALRKVGAVITNPYADNGKEPRYFKATGKNGQLVCWYVQKHWQKGTPEAVSVHSPHPDTDAMTDIFMDTYFHTIRSAAASLA
jgi:hypothetical protein